MVVLQDSPLPFSNPCTKPVLSRRKTSKTLGYIDSAIVVPFFGIFICVWTYLRHYINLHILWATLTEFRTIGPYQLNWETEQYKCLLSQVIAFSLLATLQAVNLFWLFLILRVAKRFLFTSVMTDDRSDDDDDDDEDIHEDNVSSVASSIDKKTAAVSCYSSSLSSAAASSNLSKNVSSSGVVVSSGVGRQSELDSDPFSSSSSSLRSRTTTAST